MTLTPLIFDIDGTLLDSEHLDAKYFVRAVYDVAGKIQIADDWSIYKKVTDVGIITEILLQNGITDTAPYVAAIRNRFGELLDNYFKGGGTCIPKPGAREFLAHIRSLPQFVIGIATGGWRHSALMKLAVAGINAAKIPMSTSDDGDDRAEIMAHCLDTFEGPLGTPVYFGDGTWDLEASRHLGWGFIGIGKKLKDKSPLLFEDFSDINAVMNSIAMASSPRHSS